jgi:Ser-tRNA(Ala) deacylase AlaX
VEALVPKNDVILHVGTFEPAGATFEKDSEVECHVDEATRRLNARNHSAGHLLDIAMRMAGRDDLKPGKGYHFATGAYVEYIGAIEAADREPLMATLNEKCKDLIENTPAEKKVFKKMCTYEEANTELSLAGGVPSYIPEGESLRVLKLVEGDHGCPCGGTHVDHVNDIAGIEITGIKKKGKNVQVKYTIKAV